MSPRVSALALTAALGAAGCVVQPGGPGDFRQEISVTSGVRLEPEFRMTVGRTGMRLASWGLKMAGEEDFSLDGVRRVEIGVYRPHALDGDSPDRPALARFRPAGWQSMFRLHDAGEDVVVLSRQEAGQLRGLAVVVAEPDEWVIVRMTGDLQKALDRVLEAAFEEAGRPDLHRRVVVERNGSDGPEDGSEARYRHGPASSAERGRTSGRSAEVGGGS